MKNLISITDLTTSEILDLIERAQAFKEGHLPPPHAFVLALLFLQESTRTRVGFETAAYRLGGSATLVSETKLSSNMSGAESVEDTFRVLEAYGDIVCIRDSDSDRIKKFADLSKKRIINCGNGFDEHPTQALIDLFSIHSFLGHLEEFKIAIVGDLSYMRPAHSLLLALGKLKKISVLCISPRELCIPKRYKDEYLKGGNTLEEASILDIKDCDVVYMAGFAPQTLSGVFSDDVRMRYQLNELTTKNLQSKSIVLCPLPRIDEIAKGVDLLPQAKYFEQSELGLYMRMSIIQELLTGV